MARLYRRHASLTSTGLFLLLSLLPASALAATLMDPIQMTFSDTAYGPDGPWQAVSVSAGGSMDLYPAVCGYTVVLDSPLTGPAAQGAGSFNAQQANALLNGATTLNQSGGAGFDVSGQYWAANMSLGQGVGPVEGATMLAGVPTINGPGNNRIPLSVGLLDLGFDKSSFTVAGCVKGDGTSCTTMNSPPAYYYGQNKTSSSSFGLHVGSAAMGINGSFYYGGYDQSRVLGPVGVQPIHRLAGGGNLSVDSESTGMSTIWNDFFYTSLNALAVDTVLGSSPFSSPDTSNLLPNTSGMTVQFDPSSPYLYLPQQTCDSIAQRLPVTYNSTLNLYLWNTTSPLYPLIVQSPTVLSLALASQNAPDVTINVPFSLLNLTLEAPLVQTPTPYFPCSPTNGSSILGRAVLQAAYLGANWMPDTPDGVFFFGQAPGPNMTTAQPAGIASNASSFSAAPSGNWTSSWTGTWSPINNGSSSGGNGGGLSAGASAGIGVGVALFVILLAALGAAIFFLRRKNKRLVAAAAGKDAPGELPAMAKRVSSDRGYSPWLHSAPAAATMAPVELDHEAADRYEVDGVGPKDVPGGVANPVEAPAQERPAELPS